LNAVSDCLRKEEDSKRARRKDRKKKGGEEALSPKDAKKNNAEADNNAESPTFVQDIFEGVLVNTTTCLRCEQAHDREEKFLDLSLDIADHSSLTDALRQFSSSERLNGSNKYLCDFCCRSQEAVKR
jgi:ubiquitin C-terminal hydrolase